MVGNTTRIIGMHTKIERKFSVRMMDRHRLMKNELKTVRKRKIEKSYKRRERERQAMEWRIAIKKLE